MRTVGRFSLKEIALLGGFSIICIVLSAFWIQLWPLLWIPILYGAYMFGETGGVAAGGIAAIYIAGTMMLTGRSIILGSDIWLEMASLLFIGGGAGYLIRTEKEMKGKAVDLAIRDALTGLHNRMYFIHRIEDERKRADRTQERLGLMVIDLDHFKRINDTFGHKAGDRVLEEVSKIICAAVRETDLVARIGGEEIAVILPNTGGTEEIIAERVREKVEEAGHFKGPEWCTASIGVAYYDGIDEKGAANEEELFEMADHAVYRAKSEGRNRVCIWGKQKKEKMISTKEDGAAGNEGKA